MKKLILIIFCSLFYFPIKSQTPWVKQIGGSLNDHGKSIIDAAGNTYIYGDFEGTCDFNPGSGTYNMISDGSRDAFLIKLDVNGNFSWAYKIGGTYDESIKSISVDVNGNIYATGFFSDTYDFDPSAGIFNMTSSGLEDIFIIKLSSIGTLIWAKQFGDAGDDIGSNISLDNQNNIVTSGNFQGTIDFDSGSGIQNLTSSISNTYILKLNNSGNFIWVKQFAGNSNSPNCMLLDSFDNIYISGSYQNQVDFDPGMGIYNLSNIGGAYLSKLSSLGNFIWTKQIGSDGSTLNLSIALDNYGNIYNAGNYVYTQDFDPNSGTFNLTALGIFFGDMYILKLDTSGNFVWVKGIGGYTQDIAFSVITKLSDVYIGGFFNDNVDFDPGPGSYLSISNGGSDIFILKLDTMGNFSSVKTIGGIYDDMCFSLCFDGLNNIYSTGSFADVCDFNPNLVPYNVSSFGNDDIYIYKIESFTLGIKEINSDNPINIYPNPSSKSLNISSKEFDNYRIEIINSSGQIVLRTDSNKNNSEVDISSLEEGLYFVKLSNQNKLLTTKFIKE